MLTSSPDGPYESRQSVPTHWIGIVTCSHVLLILAKPKRSEYDLSCRLQTRLWWSFSKDQLLSWKPSDVRVLGLLSSTCKVHNRSRVKQYLAYYHHADCIITE